MKTLISTTFLDSQKVLEKYFSKDFDEKDVKKYLFLESRNKDTYKPDYIFKNVIDDFIKIEVLLMYWMNYPICFFLKIQKFMLKKSILKNGRILF